jgi:hypothetical protein
MTDSTQTFVLADLALSFYLTGAIWAHEVDIFRSWQLINPADFRVVQATHWKKLPYWVLAPVGIALLAAIALLWIHPASYPRWALWGNFLCQMLSLVLTVTLWGRWQAKLSRDSAGSASPYLKRILKTHWIRTLLITAAAAFLVIGTIAA